MTAKEIRLALASFLDSAHARGVADAGTTKRIATAYLTAAFEEAGKHPRLFDGEDVRVVVTELLPGWFAPRDADVDAAESVLDALLLHLAETEVVAHPFEQRQALGAACEALVADVRAGTNERRRVSAEESTPFVHGAPKLGRNDPCSCGSGKKYKKCHGKGL